MKNILLALALIISVALPSCGGGGGGSDPGTDPDIVSAFVFDEKDPAATPIMSANIGDFVMVHFCIYDPDLDANKVTASQYFPPNAAVPFYPPEIGLLPAQTQADECFFWGPFEIIGPSGFWLLRLEIQDAKGNLSLPFDVEPFEALP